MALIIITIGPKTYRWEPFTPIPLPSVTHKIFHRPSNLPNSHDITPHPPLSRLFQESFRDPLRLGISSACGNFRVVEWYLGNPRLVIERGIIGDCTDAGDKCDG